MKTLFLLLASFGVAVTASAQSFSVSSVGGDLIPASGKGSSVGWDLAGLDYDLVVQAAVSPPGTASVTVPEPVVSIESIVLEGLNHTWVGDIMAVLRDPLGVGHLIWIRPGLAVGSVTGGNGASFSGGTYTFVESGTPGSLGPLPAVAVGMGGIATGTYDQSFSTNDAVNPIVWPSGDEMVFNTPLSAITGPAGTWSIEIYDFVGDDVGSFTGFTLNGITPNGTIVTSFCVPVSPNSTGNPAILFGDFTGPGGSLHLEVAQGPPGDFAIMLIGNQTGSLTLGAGFLCMSPFFRYNIAGSPMNSIGQFNAAGVWQNLVGTSSIGSGFDVPDTIPATGSPLIMAGQSWGFQCWYRDSSDPLGSNSTRGLLVGF